MNNFKYYAACVLVMGLCSFIRPTEESYIKGHLRSKSHKSVAGITVFLTGIVDNGMGKTVTDKKGNFTLDFDLGSEMIPSVYYINNHNDTILLETITHFKNDEQQMTFWIK